jgi:hypothetical protein
MLAPLHIDGLRTNATKANSFFFSQLWIVTFTSGQIKFSPFGFAFAGHVAMQQKKKK